jgi:hypothetical protein
MIGEHTNEECNTEKTKRWREGERYGEKQRDRETD